MIEGHSVRYFAGQTLMREEPELLLARGRIAKATVGILKSQIGGRGARCRSGSVLTLGLELTRSRVDLSSCGYALGIRIARRAGRSEASYVSGSFALIELHSETALMC